MLYEVGRQSKYQSKILIETPRIPLPPAAIKGTLVLYIGTFLFNSVCLGVSPFAESAASKVYEQPIKNATESSFHSAVISVLVSIRFPSLYTLYRGRSVRISQFAARCSGTLGSPGRVSPMSGHLKCEGLRNYKHSNLLRLTRQDSSCRDFGSLGHISRVES